MKTLHMLQYEHEKNPFMIARILNKNPRKISKQRMPRTLKTIQNVFDEPPNYLRILRERTKSNNYQVSTTSFNDGYGCRVSTRLGKLSSIKTVSPEYNFTIAEIAEKCEIMCEDDDM